jgi:putative transposase
MKPRIPRGAKPPLLKLSDQQKQVLERIVRRGTSPQQLVTRARIVLNAATADRNAHIAADLQTTTPTVRTWRQRWLAAAGVLQEVEASADDKALEAQIIAVLSDQPRSGAPAKFSAEEICQIIAVACEKPVDSGRPITEWTPRELGEEVVKQQIVSSISTRQVGRFLKSGGLEAASLALLAQQRAGRQS